MIEIQTIIEVFEHLHGLKAIVFDLDDTLYSEKEYVKSGYQAISTLLPQVDKAEEKLWKLFSEKKSAIDELLISENIYSDELKLKCLQAYRFQRPNIHLYDRVKEMLINLKESGMLLGIITDGRPEGQWAKIEALGLKQYVSHIVVTDELGGALYRKPNEKAFCLMRERLGVSFEEMCYVGDNIKKDFIAPEELGMKSIFFKNKDGLYFEE